MDERDTTRRDFLKRTGAAVWIVPVMTAVQASPALAGVETSVTTTVTTTIPEE